MTYYCSYIYLGYLWYIDDALQYNPCTLRFIPVQEHNNYEPYFFLYNYYISRLQYESIATGSLRPVA